jgi:hypothetical protein
MKTPPDILMPDQSPKFSMEAARLLLEQALEAEQSGENAEDEAAHKHAMNAHTGASIMVPSEVIITPSSALPKQA